MNIYRISTDQISPEQVGPLPGAPLIEEADEEEVYLVRTEATGKQLEEVLGLEEGDYDLE